MMEMKATGERSKIPKGCVIGLAVAGGLLLLIMITLGVVYYYRTDIRGAALDMVEERIVEAGPTGYTPDEIHRIFELYVIAIDSGSVGPKEGEKAALIFQDIFADDEITDEEALSLLSVMREITDLVDDGSLPPIEPADEVDGLSDDESEGADD